VHMGGDLKNKLWLVRVIFRVGVYLGLAFAAGGPVGRH